MTATPADPLEVARVSVPALVGLNQAAAGLTLQASRVRARMTGEYLSGFKGRGMEFAESRPYEPGDDVRNLHWRVMARTGRPFTKQFREERERPVFVWVDLGSRMFFGTKGAYKAVVAARAAALVGWAAHRHGDRIGGVIFSDDVHAEVKPGRGKAAVLYLIRQIATHAAWDDDRGGLIDTDAARDALIRLRRVARPGSLVVMLSDFATLDAVAENNLAQLARHSEIVLMHIFDDIEAELPPPGTYRLSDGTDEFVLDAADPDYRALYADRFSERVDRLGRLARRNHMTYLSCRTWQDPALILRERFSARRGR